MHRPNNQIPALGQDRLAMTSFQDRTNEFQAVADSILHRTNSNLPARKVEAKPAPSSLVRQTINVNKMASSIGKRTSETANLLKELMKLAKSNEPFGDPSDKIENLTFVISQQINGIKADIEQLQNVCADSTSSFSMTRVTKSTNRHASDHSVTIINTLNSNLLRTTKEFNDALQIRTQSLKTQQERKDKYRSRRPGGGPSPVFRPLAIEMIDDDVNDDDDGDVKIVVPSLQTEDDLILQRSNQIQDIEVHITEIKGIFDKLTSLVAMQGEKIRRIEDNVQETMTSAEGAVEQLLKYLKGLSNNQWLIMKVFLILLFFILVFVLFFA